MAARVTRRDPSQAIWSVLMTLFEFVTPIVLPPSGGIPQHHAMWSGRGMTPPGRTEKGPPSDKFRRRAAVFQKSLAEFARSRRQLCCHTDAACPLRVRRPQAAEEKLQPQGSLLAAQPLRPTLQTCRRHVCFTLRRRKNTLRGASVELFATRGPPPEPSETGPVGRGGAAGVSAACRFAAGGGMRSLCRRCAERSGSPLAEKASAFFDRLRPAAGP